MGDNLLCVQNVWYVLAPNVYGLIHVPFSPDLFTAVSHISIPEVCFSLS
jgi:hypothetical protein